MLELILSVVFIIYILFIGQLIYGFNQMKRFTKKDTIPTTTFFDSGSFFGMKAENLPKLLHAISNLNYPKQLFEVLLVDDDSEEVFSPRFAVFSLQVIKTTKEIEFTQKRCN